MLKIQGLSRFVFEVLLKGPYQALKGPYKALKGPYKALKGPYKALKKPYKALIQVSGKHSPTGGENSRLMLRF